MPHSEEDEVITQKHYQTTGETVSVTSAMFQANKGAKRSKHRPRISQAKNVPTDGNGLAKKL